MLNTCTYIPTLGRLGIFQISRATPASHMAGHLCRLSRLSARTPARTPAGGRLGSCDDIFVA